MLLPLIAMLISMLGGMLQTTFGEKLNQTAARYSSEDEYWKPSLPMIDKGGSKAANTMIIDADKVLDKHATLESWTLSLLLAYTLFLQVNIAMAGSSN